MKEPQEWRFTNLLEILRFYAESYCLLVGQLQGTGLQIASAVESRKDAEMASGLIDTLLVRLREMKAECDKIGLEASSDAISVMLDRWEQYGDQRLFMVQCPSLTNCIASELKRRGCFILPKASEKLYSSPFGGWEPIVEAFPDIRDDVEEMNKCRAFGRDSAAVFHVLLVVEHGLIDLGKFLRATDHKQGWDATFKALEKIFKEQYPAAPKHIQRHWSFLELVNRDMVSMKMAWRNKVNHAANRLVVITSDFKPQIAEKIITACHGFMLLLATEGPRKKKRKK